MALLPISLMQMRSGCLRRTDTRTHHDWKEFIVNQRLDYTAASPAAFKAIAEMVRAALA